MKPKRLQVVVLEGGQSKLTVDGRGPYGLGDLVAERGCEMFRRALFKRLQSKHFFRLDRPLDMMALACSAFEYGGNYRESGRIQYNISWTRRGVDVVFNAICESYDTQDAALTLQGEYMERYRRLFVHLYGKQLEAKGINLED